MLKFTAPKNLYLLTKDNLPKAYITEAVYLFRNFGLLAPKDI